MRRKRIKKPGARLEKSGRREFFGDDMTGEELRTIQRAAGLSNSAMLERLGFRGNTAAAARRLRRWKAGSEPVPAAVAEAARALVDGNA